MLVGAPTAMTDKLQLFLNNVAGHVVSGNFTAACRRFVFPNRTCLTFRRGLAYQLFCRYDIRMSADRSTWRTLCTPVSDVLAGQRLRSVVISLSCHDTGRAHTTDGLFPLLVRVSGTLYTGRAGRSRYQNRQLQTIFKDVSILKVLYSRKGDCSQKSTSNFGLLTAVQLC